MIKSYTCFTILLCYWSTYDVALMDNVFRVFDQIVIPLSLRSATVFRYPLYNNSPTLLLTIPILSRYYYIYLVLRDRYLHTADCHQQEFNLLAGHSRCNKTRSRESPYWIALRMEFSSCDNFTILSFLSLVIFAIGEISS